MVALFSMPSAALAFPEEPLIRFELETSKAAVAEKIRGTVVVTFAEGMHAYQNPPSQDYMIPLEITAGNDRTRLISVDYPRGIEKMAGGEMAAVYMGEVSIPVVVAATSGAGEQSLALTVSYQQCDDDQCFMPTDQQVTAAIFLSGEGPAPPAQVGELETPPPAGTASTDAAAAAQAAQQGGWLEETLQNTFSGGNLVILFLLLFLVGIAINLTPCVYPLIPITIAFFANQAGENKGQRVQLGLMYMLGIAGTYALVGGIAAATGAIFGELFTNPWMLVFLAVFMFALALSMFDVYQLGLPPALTKHLKGRSGVVGALIMGLLVGLAAAPCAGPLIAAVFTEAAKVGNPALSVGMFLAVGLGIGLPYLFLAILSSGVKALPQAGSWLKTVKAVLGLVVIGVGLSYLLQAFGNRISSETHIIVWASFFAGCGLYLLIFETNANNRLAQMLKGVTGLIAGIIAGISIAGLFVAPSGPGIQWEEFTMERYEQALASGQPILIDATANWCVQCHEIERDVFSRQDVVDATEGIVALKIDWSTGVSRDYIRETQERFNIAGLPHIIVQRPGGEDVAVLNAIHNPQAFIDLLQSARSDP